MIPYIILLVLVIAFGYLRKKLPAKVDLTARDNSEPPSPPPQTKQATRAGGTTPATSNEPQIPPEKWWQRKKWWKENEFFIILGLIMFHVILATVWWDWWRINIFFNLKMWILHAVLITYALMVPRGKAPLHHKLGRLGVPFTLAAMLFVLVWKPGVPQATARTIPTAPLGPPSGPLGMPVFEKGCDGVRTYFSKYLANPKDVEEMVVISRKKSGCNQFDSTGRPLLGKGIGHELDIGVMQIDQIYWAEFAYQLGYDLSQEEGNLDMALWVRNHYSVKEFVTSGVERDLNRAKEITIIGPVGSWSEKVPIILYKNCFGKPQGPLWVMDDKGNKYLISPIQMPDHVIRSRTLQYQSATSEPEKVLWKCS